MSGIYIGLGANLGDRQSNLAAALRLLPPLVRVEAVSALYESPPQAPAPPPNYLNAACRVTTDLEPDALLAHLKDIERRLGRQSAEHWAPRLIDLDLLLYDEEIIDTDDLVVPHERMAERAFVLQPLLDLDPELEDPLTAEPLRDILEDIGVDGLTLVAAVGWQDETSRQ